MKGKYPLVPPASTLTFLEFHVYVVVEVFLAGPRNHDSSPTWHNTSHTTQQWHPLHNIRALKHRRQRCDDEHTLNPRKYFKTILEIDGVSRERVDRHGPTKSPRRTKKRYFSKLLCFCRNMKIEKFLLDELML